MKSENPIIKYRYNGNTFAHECIAGCDGTRYTFREGSHVWRGHMGRYKDFEKEYNEIKAFIDLALEHLGMTFEYMSPEEDMINRAEKIIPVTGPGGIKGVINSEGLFSPPLLIIAKFKPEVEYIDDVVL